jgi:hypothetical protein
MFHHTLDTRVASSETRRRNFETMKSVDDWIYKYDPPRNTTITTATAATTRMN